MSIFRKLSILFLISLILMAIIGSWMDSINAKRIDNLVKEKYIKIVDNIFENIENKTKVNEIIEANKLKTIEKYSFNSNIIYERNYTFGKIKILKETFDDEFIIYINYLDEEYFLKTPDEENLNDKTILNILISLDIIALILIFLYILKLLSPLKVITKKITSFSNGDFTSRTNINSKDEIGLLSKTFDNMANNLENQIKTKEELLRDIGHELRTPITKGKFAVEKIDDEGQKELLQKIFIDLETLTNELIELEKLNSNELEKTTFESETLIIEALDKLYIDDESKIDLVLDDNFKINGDLYYLTKAVKNLIDNALKYSTKLPVIIEVKQNSIIIKNQGEKLSQEIEYYLKPFTQESTARNGFGLGLSIVKKVIDKHKYKLNYNYAQGYNIFQIDFK
ncbi:two-component sensor histidine kinase [Malaciobacter pacificus]|uniref:histidine kinase n=1 Tax=Malaciobacter pacificus TaxID=1080223 RepID=A0A5C2H9P0_9BACT|nr:ArsS family sensor histidine kinase [Malaciobacter pacificus]QEP35657.1 two-component system sensor histidine kinase [Malaciobacter pacificus]GGD45194.1 two-component sensor histidine kinase [Malaciobacter pacificus]